MRRVALFALVILAPFGCKKEDVSGVEPTPSKPLATAPANLPSTNPAAAAKLAANTANSNDPAAAMAQLGNALAAQGGNVKVVSWRDIAPLLTDEIGGWKADGDVKGETNSMGAFSVSEAHRHYKKDALSGDLKIVDTSMNAMLASAFKMGRTISTDASDHYQRGVDVAGQPGLEEWTASSKRGHVTVLVGDRFLVELEVNGVPDAKSIVEMVGKLNLAKLAALK